MFKYYYSNKKPFWNAPVFKYIPDPFADDSWLQFSLLPDNAKINFVNENAAQFVLPFDMFNDNMPSIFKVENDKIKRYYLIKSYEIITNRSIVFNLELDYYLTYCRYLIKILDSKNIWLKRSGINNINDGDHTLLNNVKHNIVNDNLIKVEELLYTPTYEEKTLYKRNFFNELSTLDKKTNTIKTWPKQTISPFNKNENLTRYGIYAVFLMKNADSFATQYALFPIFAENDYLLRRQEGGNAYYCANTFYPPYYDNQTVYSIQEVPRLDGFKNSFIGFFKGPILTMRDFGEKFDYHIVTKQTGSTITNNFVFFFLILENLKPHDFVLNLRPNNVTPIEYNLDFIRDPSKLFNRLTLFNENMLLKDLFSINITNKPFFNLFFNNGFCFSPVKYNNENATNAIFTMGGVLGLLTDNYIQEQINNKNQMNAGIMQQGFNLASRVVNPNSWNALGVVGGSVTTAQGIADLFYKNAINEANLKNTSQNVSNIDFKSSYDFLKTIGELTKNKTTNLDTMNQFFWINELSQKDKEKINLLYEENGFLINSKFSLSGYINKIKQNDPNRKFFPILIDWSYYLNNIYNQILNYQTSEYLPIFTPLILQKAINLMTNSLIIAVRNEI